MWRINEFGGLTKQVFCGGEGVYMVFKVLCLYRLSPHELQSIKLLLQCWTVWSRGIQRLYKTILILTLNLTQKQPAKLPWNRQMTADFNRSLAEVNYSCTVTVYTRLGGLTSSKSVCLYWNHFVGWRLANWRINEYFYNGNEFVLCSFGGLANLVD